jgi:tRNA-splicing ligase RtcB (3'-phosphate/5'-hydroxy nucleic acid ligase)
MHHNGAINCASRERQGDRDLWVGPPGATPAFPGQRGVVSSTGNDALILEGVENAEAAWSFYSTAHGAGRLFDRRDAKRQLWRPETNAWTRCCGVMLIGADFDEPDGLSSVPDMLAAHAGAVKLLHTLRPVIVVIAGRSSQDGPR